MQRLIFEPVCGSWVLETTTANETVIQDYAELSPAGVGFNQNLTKKTGDRK